MQFALRAVVQVTKILLEVEPGELSLNKTRSLITEACGQLLPDVDVETLSTKLHYKVRTARSASFDAHESVRIFCIFAIFFRNECVHKLTLLPVCSNPCSGNGERR